MPRRDLLSAPHESKQSSLGIRAGESIDAGEYEGAGAGRSGQRLRIQARANSPRGATLQPATATGLQKTLPGTGEDPGFAVDPGIRHRFESATGADLSAVRVHTGLRSNQVAAMMGAHAFTVGQDIHFAAGKYDPGTKASDRLIHHELVHTLQQRHLGTCPQYKLKVSHPSDPGEREADEIADELVAGAEHVQRPVTTAGCPMIQRKVGFEFETSWLIATDDWITRRRGGLVNGKDWTLTVDQSTQNQDELKHQFNGKCDDDSTVYNAEFVTSPFEDDDKDALSAAMDHMLNWIQSFSSVLNNDNDKIAPLYGHVGVDSGTTWNLALSPVEQAFEDVKGNLSRGVVFPDNQNSEQKDRKLIYGRVYKSIEDQLKNVVNEEMKGDARLNDHNVFELMIELMNDGKLNDLDWNTIERNVHMICGSYVDEMRRAPLVCGKGDLVASPQMSAGIWLRRLPILFKCLGKDKAKDRLVRKSQVDLHDKVYKNAERIVNEDRGVLLSELESQGYVAARDVYLGILALLGMYVKRSSLDKKFLYAKAMPTIMSRTRLDQLPLLRKILPVNVKADVIEASGNAKRLVDVFASNVQDPKVPRITVDEWLDGIISGNDISWLPFWDQTVNPERWVPTLKRNDEKNDELEEKKHDDSMRRMLEGKDEVMHVYEFRALPLWPVAKWKKCALRLQKYIARINRGEDCFDKNKMENVGGLGGVELE